MENKFQEMIQNLKNEINGFITKDSSADEIKKYQELGSKVDELKAEYDKAESENKGLKEIIVSQVKESGTKKEPEKDSPENKSIDDIILETGDEIIAKRSEN